MVPNLAFRTGFTSAKAYNRLPSTKFYIISRGTCFEPLMSCSRITHDLKFTYLAPLEDFRIRFYSLSIRKLFSRYPSSYHMALQSFICEVSLLTAFSISPPESYVKTRVYNHSLISLLLAQFIDAYRLIVFPSERRNIIPISFLTLWIFLAGVCSYIQYTSCPFITDYSIPD